MPDLYSEYDDNVTPKYEGEVEPNLDHEWAQYCLHGHYHGLTCEKCPTAVVPFYHSNRDFGDETTNAD